MHVHCNMHHAGKY